MQLKMAFVTSEFLPKDIHSDVTDWMTEGWKGDKKEANNILRHLSAMKKVYSSKCDFAVISEEGLDKHKDFNKMLSEIIPKLPNNLDICFLTHYVGNWDGCQYLSEDKTLCLFTSQVYHLDAYLIRMSHIQYLLSIYDRPFQHITKININIPGMIHSRACMVYKPLFANLKNQQQSKYYIEGYGFEKSETIKV